MVKFSPLDKVFWLRAIFAVASGLIASLLSLTGQSLEAYRGVAVAGALYLASYYLAKLLTKGQLQPNQATKLVTTGLGSFITLFLFIWILYTTLRATVFP